MGLPFLSSRTENMPWESEIPAPSGAFQICAGIQNVGLRVIKPFPHRHASMSWAQAFDTVTNIHVLLFISPDNTSLVQVIGG